MDSTMDFDRSEVSEWYRDKTIFITGGTGFMGKVLVEKLLRSCPVKKIYMLVRPKKGSDIQKRLEDTLSFKLFDKLREHRPEYLKKVEAVKGDITMEGLGLSDDEELKLAEEVQVVFHSAATINFQEPIRVAVDMNMLGTKRVINLCKKMTKLQAMIHVSTAYANCHLQETYEELYPAPFEPNRLIQLTEWFDDKVLDKMTPDLVQPRPNTYTYTKALAEHILAKETGNIPFSIVRPSIVCGAWREPEPGWVDNMFAFTGLLVGMGKGALRSLYVNEGIKVDFIPVDMPINLMIVAAYNTAVKKYTAKSDTSIYCCSSGVLNPITGENLHKYLLEISTKLPQANPLWFPTGSTKSIRILHDIHVFFVNILPAHIADFICKILGKKQIAVKLCNKMIKALNALEYFMWRDFTFHSDNCLGLWNAISPADQKVFHFDVREMDWRKYIADYQRGCKKFILNESLEPEDIKKAQKNLNKLWWIHRAVQVVMLLMAFQILSSEFSQNCCSSLFNEMVKLSSDLWLTGPAGDEEDGFVIEVLPDDATIVSLNSSY